MRKLWWVLIAVVLAFAIYEFFIMAQNFVDTIASQLK
jgi:hypothetical protein